MNYLQILLALFIFVSRIKGDPRIASLFPFDLTVSFALAVYLVIAFRLRQFDWGSLPRILWLYLPFICLMLFSVSYSPLPIAGIEKALRFMLLTGLAIFAPYFVLDSPTRIRNHFVTLLILYFLVTLEPLSQMGAPIADDGDGRLMVAGGSTIELGTSAVVGVTIILYMILPQLALGSSVFWYYFKKILAYLGIVIFFAALIGAGARSATISLAIIVLINLYFYPQQRMDLFIVACLVSSSLLVINIPEHSLEYLSTLIHSDANSLFNWRGHLMRLGLELIAEHPILGVGLGGFPYFGTIPPPSPWYLYNWPHNGIIEIGCEMGLLAAVIACLLIILPFVETFRQLADKDFQFKVYSRMTLAVMTIGVITFMNTGDINDQRPMWLYMSLPFVIRGFARKEVLAKV